MGIAVIRTKSAVMAERSDTLAGQRYVPATDRLQTGNIQEIVRWSGSDASSPNSMAWKRGDGGVTATVGDEGVAATNFALKFGLSR
jgi:hypothetical protein